MQQEYLFEWIVWVALIYLLARRRHGTFIYFSLFQVPTVSINSRRLSDAISDFQRSFGIDFQFGRHLVSARAQIPVIRCVCSIWWSAQISIEIQSTSCSQTQARFLFFFRVFAVCLLHAALIRVQLGIKSLIRMSGNFRLLGLCTECFYCVQSSGIALIRIPKGLSVWNGIQRVSRAWAYSTGEMLIWNNWAPRNKWKYNTLIQYNIMLTQRHIIEQFNNSVYFCFVFAVLVCGRNRGWNRGWSAGFTRNTR